MNKIRKQFPILTRESKLIYFDNGATTLKPKSVIEAEEYYLKTISANPHTNDYQIAYQANEIIAQTRQQTAKFINAASCQEIVFTSGTTFAINQIAQGIKKILKPGDEILTTSLEHSANLLPWIVVAKQVQAKVKTLELNSDGGINLEALKQKITLQTKIVTFAHVSNTFGYENNVLEISKVIRKINPNVIIVVDAAQSVAHTEIDVQKWDIDFLAFSAHKMYGPFGLGILWGKMALLDQLEPLLYGGGMSLTIDENLEDYYLATTPEKFEGGTPNISAIYAFQKSLDFIESISIKEIKSYEKMLKHYFIDQVKQANLQAKIDFYNLDSLSPIVILNVKGINPQDIATFLDLKYHIAARSGSHCARRTVDLINTKVSLRISFAVYNTVEEIDVLIEALKHTDEFLDVLF
ncbi:aminotransferase class V-fold PLP-dependent enzyme [Mesoplasma syrphidae]|uniref:cysteine desulfurase n=1 Tax=Mesoplasma syrphidae TaxID=225999 RepID=A0A2K9BJC0_9MOLU|nr:aminotransferase class V-fold PLP-dependent enzyme [Mesoplasma syrphidae]AUF83431.1 aminotransferase class V-fold PLP-dependent enzyme [Mesoplasma syrphidae]